MIDVSHDDALAVAGLPAHHADPFGRILVAQAANRGVTLMSADAALARYDVDIVLVG